MDVDENETAAQMASANEAAVGIAERDGFLTIFFKGASAFGDMYWPIHSIDLRKIMEKEKTNQFMVCFNGHLSDIHSSPCAPTITTPQDVFPVQSLNDVDDGKSPICSVNHTEKFTIIFTTGQLKS